MLLFGIESKSCCGFGVYNVYQKEKWSCLTNNVSTMQERVQHLCQEIDKHIKLGKTILEEKVPTCKITSEVKTKLIEVMRVLLDDRLKFNEECFSQCGKHMQKSFLL